MKKFGTHHHHVADAVTATHVPGCLVGGRCCGHRRRRRGAEAHPPVHARDVLGAERHRGPHRGVAVQHDVRAGGRVRQRAPRRQGQGVASGGEVPGLHRRHGAELAGVPDVGHRGVHRRRVQREHAVGAGPHLQLRRHGGAQHCGRHRQAEAGARVLPRQGPRQPLAGDRRVRVRLLRSHVQPPPLTVFGSTFFKFLNTIFIRKLYI